MRLRHLAILALLFYSQIISAQNTFLSGQPILKYQGPQAYMTG